MAADSGKAAKAPAPNKTKKLRAGDIVDFMAATIESPGTPDPVNFKDADPEAGKVSFGHRGISITWDAEKDVNQKLRKRAVGRATLDEIKGEKASEFRKKTEEERKRRAEERPQKGKKLGPKGAMAYEQAPPLTKDNAPYNPDKTREFEKNDYFLFKIINIMPRYPHQPEKDERTKLWHCGYEVGKILVRELPTGKESPYFGTLSTYNAEEGAYNTLVVAEFQFFPPNIREAQSAMYENPLIESVISKHWLQDGSVVIVASYKAGNRETLMEQLRDITNWNFVINDLPQYGSLFSSSGE